MGFLTSPATDQTLEIINKSFLTGYTQEIERQKDESAMMARAQAAADRQALMEKMQEDRQGFQWALALEKLGQQAKNARENNTIKSALKTNEKTYSTLLGNITYTKKMLANVQGDAKYGQPYVAFWQDQVRKAEEEAATFLPEMQQVETDALAGNPVRLLRPKYNDPAILEDRSQLLSPEAEAVRQLQDETAQAKLDLMKTRIEDIKLKGRLAQQRSAGGRGNTGGKLLSTGVEYVAKLSENQYEVEAARIKYNKLLKDPVYGPMIQAGDPEGIKMRNQYKSEVDRAEANLGSHLAANIKLFKESKTSSVPQEVKDEIQYLYDNYRNGNIAPAMVYDPMSPQTATGSWLLKHKVIEAPPPQPQSSPRLFRLR